MQQYFLSLSLLLSLTAAQTTSSGSTSSVCAAQPVLEACLATTEANAEGCSTTNYGCLCEKWTDVITCFQQCPNDARLSSVKSMQATYCNDASAYPSSSSTVASTSASSSVAAAITDSSATGSSAPTPTVDNNAAQTSSSTTSPSSTATGKSSASRDLMIGAGAMLLGVAGFAAALL